MSVAPLNHVFSALDELLSGPPVTEVVYAGVLADPKQQAALLEFLADPDNEACVSGNYDSLPSLESIVAEHGSFTNATYSGVHGQAWFGFGFQWAEMTSDIELGYNQLLMRPKFQANAEAILRFISSVDPLPERYEHYDAYTNQPNIREAVKDLPEAIWLQVNKGDLNPAIPSLRELSRLFGSYEAAVIQSGAAWPSWEGRSGSTHDGITFYSSNDALMEVGSVLHAVKPLPKSCAEYQSYVDELGDVSELLKGNKYAVFLQEEQAGVLPDAKFFYEEDVRNHLDGIVWGVRNLPKDVAAEHMTKEEEQFRARQAETGTSQAYEQFRARAVRPDRYRTQVDVRELSSDFDMNKFLAGKTLTSVSGEGTLVVVYGDEGQELSRTHTPNDK